MVTHVVKKGETLSSLSQKYLGRESRYLKSLMPIETSCGMLMACEPE